MGVDKTNGFNKNFYLSNNEPSKYFDTDSKLDDLIQQTLKKGVKKEENIPLPYSREAWNAMSDEEKAAILAKKDMLSEFGFQKQSTAYAATAVNANQTAAEQEEVQETPKTSEEEPDTSEAQPKGDAPTEEASAEEENKSTPAPPGSPDRYKGENKPANTADWAKLNGNHFEAIDEPDENGNIPTRPIHGKVTIEGEIKDGENPKRITITDENNGFEYVFELDESVEDKVVYRCVKGPGGTYTKGNDYELRTINGVPMLVQMKDSEGYGVGVGKTNGKKSTQATPEETGKAEAPNAAEEAEIPEETGKAEAPNAAEEAEAPKETGKSETSRAPKAATTPEERKAKIEADAKSIEPDLTPKKRIDSNVKAQYEKIDAAAKVAPEKAKALKEALSHDWVGASDVKKVLNGLSPAELSAVLEECIKNDKNFDIAKLIDNVFNLDKSDVYDLVVTKLQARMKELGLGEFTFKGGSKISKAHGLSSMSNWIKGALQLIADKELKFTKAYANQKNAVDEETATIKQLKQAKPTIDAANKTLAEAANANPPLKVQKDEDGDEYVQLPDGRFIFAIRDNNGNIETVSIGKGTKPKYSDPDVCYTNATIYVDTDKSNNDWEISANNPIDFNKILELAKRIFG